MRIAQVAPPLESVPPSRYGGTERVIATLTEELVQRGHEVTLFAPADSETAAHLVPTTDCALWHQQVYTDYGPFWSLTLAEVLRRTDDFDVIHSHLDYQGLPLTMATSVPVVTTLHGRLDLPEQVPLFCSFANAPLVSISNAQRKPLRHNNWVGTVYHGIDLDHFTFAPAPSPEGYLLFLGRISPEKGLDTAVRIARQAGRPLKIAARPPLAHGHSPDIRRDRRYYERVVQPLLAGPGVEMVGEVGGGKKDKLLGGAAALLFPICWPEPFGLVMAEALACGTPVLALNAGSVPEVVHDGVTGFVRDSEEGLIEAVGRIHELDRAHCRAEAEQRFSPAAMADAYEHIFDALVPWHRLAPMDLLRRSYQDAASLSVSSA